MSQTLDIVIIGLSITSSWGNDHATTYRALMKALCARGHRVHFLERDAALHAGNRDLPDPPYGRTSLYADLDQLRDEHADEVRHADLTIVGSFVPEGVAVGEWVVATAQGATAFYDIDTPVTMAKLAARDHAYLSPALVPKYDLYLSFTGGPTLRRLEREFGSPRARALYCSVDPELYRPAPDHVARWDLGYLGTYSRDCQPGLERLMLEPAREAPRRRFVVAGTQYPAEVRWPANVERRDHVPADGHCAFYNAQRFTLNVTRVDMARAGHSPGMKLFEAAACAVPIVSDMWPGLESVLEPGQEILLARDSAEVMRIISMGEAPRRRIGQRARARVLSSHTAAHRAEQLEGYLLELATT